MSRRIEIELTSKRADGTWTWRAPGAREPRGVVEASLLPAEAEVGDVLRADVDFEMDGIYVTAVHPKQARAEDSASNRIEILGPPRAFAGGVSVTMATGKRQPRGEGRDGKRPARRGRTEVPERRAAPAVRARRPGPAGEAASSARAPRRDRQGLHSDRDGAREGQVRSAPTRSTSSREPAHERRDRRRLEPVTAHRNAALAELRPEQLPVAEQLLRGGIPAVRRAIDEQNARAREEGRAEISPEPLLVMAEQLLPVMNLANWKDRAVAVRMVGRDAPLREVRSVVSGATAVSLDDEGRTLLTNLRESLEARVTALRDTWISRITTALEAGRVAEALRVSARPPEPGARLPGALAVRLANAAGEAMQPELPEQKWADLLEAVVESPVRRNVKPAALPAEAGEDVLRSARRAAGFVPELARLLGLPIPPPPGPRRPAAIAGRRS